MSTFSFFAQSWQSAVSVLFAPGTQCSQKATASEPAACEVRMYGKPIAAAEAAAVVAMKRRRVNGRRDMRLLLRSDYGWANASAICSDDDCVSLTPEWSSRSA